MPAVLALPAFWGAVSAAAAGGAAIYGANETSGAAENAANLQSKAASDTLAFQKQQAALDARNNAAAQLASYGQYAARQNQIGALGQVFGLPARDVPPPPAYLTQQASPSYDPFSATGGNPLPSTQTTPNSSSSMPANGDYQTWFQNLVKGQPSSYALINQLTPQLKAAGINISTNLEGQPSKLILPNGHYISVVDQNGAWRWMDQGTPQSNAQSAAKAPNVGTAGMMIAPPSTVATPALQMPYGGG